MLADLRDKVTCVATFKLCQGSSGMAWLSQEGFAAGDTESLDWVLDYGGLTGCSATACGAESATSVLVGGVIWWVGSGWVISGMIRCWLNRE